MRQDLLDDPSLLMVGRFENGTLVENGTALGVSSLREQAITALGGISAGRYWTDGVESVASKASIAALLATYLLRDRAFPPLGARLS